MTYDIYSRRGITYPASFFILLLFIGGGLIVGSLASAGIWAAMTGKSVLSMEKEILNPANVQAVRVLQIVSTFFIFFLPAFFVALILNKKPLRFLGFNFHFSLRQLVLVILIMVASLPLVGALSELNKIIPVPSSWAGVFKKLEETYSQQVEVLAKITGISDYLISLVVMALLPAIFEESLFRGGLQNILQRWTKSPILAIVITSIIFSAIHFSYYGFIPRLALGVVLGLIFYYSGSLWLSIVAHFFNNALVVSQIYYLTSKGKSIEEAMNESYPIWYGAVSIVLLTGLFILYKRFSAIDRRRKTPTEEIALQEKWMA
jgi:CAAX protease family protein